MTGKTLQALAAARVPSADEIKDFTPTPAHEAIAGALNSQDPTVDAKELAEAAGVSIRTLQRAVSDPAALTWICAQQSAIAEARLGAVHARIFQMAMTSRSSAWAKLFLERFDKEFKKQKILEKGSNQQFNFGDMTHDELVKTISRSFRQLQGVTSPTAGAAAAELPRDLGQTIQPGGLPNRSVGGID